MLPENLSERKSKVKSFATAYTIFVLLSILCLYFTFGLIPQVYSRYTAITNERMQIFYSNLNKSERLLMNLQRQSPINQNDAASFYTWLDRLNTDYPQPFFGKVLKSYELRINELMNSQSSDSAATDLQIKLKNLKKENSDLHKEHQMLIRQIQEAKSLN
jgi:hypothetical protein